MTSYAIEEITAIIPAAGLSSRMGGYPKALALLNNVSLLERVATMFRHAGILQTLVVTGHEHEKVTEKAHELGCRTVHNPNYKRGMFSSIQCGFSEIVKEKKQTHSLFRNVRGAFLLPVDIPLIQPSTISAIFHAWSQKMHPHQVIMIPTCDDTLGHPPLIPLQYFSSICSWPLSEGMRSFFVSLASHDMKLVLKRGKFQKSMPEDGKSNILFASVPDRGILEDLDTLESLALAESELGTTL